MSLDIIIVIAYVGIIFLIAWLSKSKLQGTSLKSHYLANNELSFADSLFSIVATEVSALTFIGIPAFAYKKDFSFIYIYFGALVGRIIIAEFIIPKVYNKGITLYEVIAEKRGSSENSRRFLSLIYISTRVLGVGVRLYAGSILVSEFFKLDIYTAVILTSFITYIYTLIGGLKAVVRTDRLQMLVFVGGGVIAHYMISKLSPMGWQDLMHLAHQNQKIIPHDFMSILSTFSIGFFGGIVFDIATHGMDQDFVQRLMACKSLKVAQNAIRLSSFLSIIVGLLFLGVGALLWSHYTLVGYPELLNNDKVFAHFIMNSFPQGVRGLMLAGVLAATMSTLDSTLNAVGSCLSNDVFRRKGRLSKVSLALDSFFIIIALVGIAFLSSRFDGVLELGLKIASWVGGSLLALFISQFWSKFKAPLNMLNVAITLILSLVGVYMNTAFGGAWQFNIHFGTLCGLFGFFICEKFLLVKTN